MLGSPRAKPGCPSATALAAGDASWPKLSHAPFSRFLSSPGEKGLWKDRAPASTRHSVRRYRNLKKSITMSCPSFCANALTEVSLI